MRPCILHVRIADRIKNGGPYRCLSLTRVFLASKTSLSIADHLRATFINRSTCQVYIETLKMPLMHKQPEKWWTNKPTNKQINRQTKHSTPAAHARARGKYTLPVRHTIKENVWLRISMLIKIY